MLPVMSILALGVVFAIMYFGAPENGGTLYKMAKFLTGKYHIFVKHLKLKL